MTRAWKLLATPLTQADPAWELFHENSKATPLEPFMPEVEAAAYLAQMPETLEYDGYPEVLLPEPAELPCESLHETLMRPVVTNALERSGISLAAASALLRYGYGVAAGEEAAPRARRVVPSAGGLHPLEIFIHAARVSGLPPGIYHYAPPRHALRQLRAGDQIGKLGLAFADGRIAQNAALLVIIAAMPERSTLRYGERGYRLALLEAGAVAQNVNLVAGALGIECANVTDYFEATVDELLGFDGLTISTIQIVAAASAASARLTARS